MYYPMYMQKNNWQLTIQQQFPAQPGFSPEEATLLADRRIAPATTKSLDPCSILLSPQCKKKCTCNGTWELKWNHLQASSSSLEVHIFHPLVRPTRPCNPTFMPGLCQTNLLTNNSTCTRSRLSKIGLNSLTCFPFLFLPH